MPNRLSSASSPYLLQHAADPVHWQEWGKAAFSEARKRRVPVLLSIGYAACHWCHVMGRESFADEEVAAAINEGFVAIKVDREERPDIDAIYMQATVAMTGGGGWPLTCFLTADGDPFLCGTYWTRTRFLQLLATVQAAWSQQTAAIRANARELTARLQAAHAHEPGSEVSAEATAAAVTRLATAFDAANGGFGGAPKFPPTMVLEFLLRHHARTGDERALAMSRTTLEAMAASGLCDQLGGGFARYAVDATWAVPHFEKMLADNALLLLAYLHWYRATGAPSALRVVHDTAAFLLRDLRTAEGGFGSSLDADAAGTEGSTYVWTPAEITAVLGPEDGPRAAALLGVDESGNFSGDRSTLRLMAEPPREWRAWRARLFAARQARPQPALDDKVVTGWNGLAIAALAEAGALLGEAAWLEAAEACAEFLWRTHTWRKRGQTRLARVSRHGVAGTATGVASDYGNLAWGLIALHQAGGRSEWLDRAGLLLASALLRFRAADGGFHDTASDAETLVVRSSNRADNAEPGGTAALANALLAYSALSGRWREEADAAIRASLVLAAADPRFSAWGLAAAEAALAGPLQVAIVGTDATAHDMLLMARAATSPGLVLAHGDGSDPERERRPLLAGRPLVEGAATAYVCRGFVCELPVTDLLALRRALDARPAATP